MSAEFDEADLIDDVAVVLLAAGSGSRLGSSRPKAFVGCAGQVLLAHSLQAFEAHEAVDSIVLVVPEDWVGPAEVLVDDLGCDRVSSIEVGGDSRAASVRAGLEAVANRRATAVLVHDAARPMVPGSLIERVLAPLAEGYDAVVPGLPVHDTVKRLAPTGRDVAETVPRDQLLLAQTPQACRADALIAALDAASDLAAITDCSQAVELNGGKVCAVVGDVRARKVTTPDDLAAVEIALGGPTTGEDVDDTVDGDLPEDMQPLDEDDLAGAAEDPAGGSA